MPGHRWHQTGPQRQNVAGSSQAFAGETMTVSAPGTVRRYVVPATTLRIEVVEQAAQVFILALGLVVKKAAGPFRSGVCPRVGGLPAPAGWPLRGHTFMVGFRKCGHGLSLLLPCPTNR